MKTVHHFFKCIYFNFAALHCVVNCALLWVINGLIVGFSKSLLPSVNEVVGRLCFDRCLSVILFKGGPHVSITLDALDFTVQASPAPAPL